MDYGSKTMDIQKRRQFFDLFEELIFSCLATVARREKDEEYEGLEQIKG